MKNPVTWLKKFYNHKFHHIFWRLIMVNVVISAVLYLVLPAEIPTTLTQEGYAGFQSKVGVFLPALLILSSFVITPMFYGYHKIVPRFFITGIAWLIGEKSTRDAKKIFFVYLRSITLSVAYAVTLMQIIISPLFYFQLLTYSSTSVVVVILAIIIAVIFWFVTRRQKYVLAS